MVPISRTRSSTLISITLTMPSSTATMNTELRMPNRKSCCPRICAMKGNTSSQVCTSYSGPSAWRSESLTSRTPDSGSTASAYSVTRPSMRSTRCAVASGR